MCPNSLPSRGRLAGFTTIELVTVIIVIAIVASLTSVRFFSRQTFSLQAARDDVLSAANTAQQLAMVRSGSGETITLHINATNLDLTIDGVSQRVASVQYPVTVTSGVSLSASPINILNFDGVGSTSVTVVTLSDSGGGTATVIIEDSGYAY